MAEQVRVGTATKAARVRLLVWRIDWNSAVDACCHSARAEAMRLFRRIIHAENNIFPQKKAIGEMGNEGVTIMVSAEKPLVRCSW